VDVGSDQYPIDEIVDDAQRILAAIRARDVEGAVSAWGGKVDNAARYMTAQLAGPAKPK
jgi:DNA-binding GntR family transcriptional regulator